MGDAGSGEDVDDTREASDPEGMKRLAALDDVKSGPSFLPGAGCARASDGGDEG